jgi:uncharacterized protein YjbI with pentapeptide repeats
VLPEDLSLAGAELDDADFSGSSMRNMNLRCAHLANAKFTKADLRGVSLCR